VCYAWKVWGLGFRVVGLGFRVYGLEKENERERKMSVMFVEGVGCRV